MLLAGGLGGGGGGGALACAVDEGCGLGSAGGCFELLLLSGFEDFSLPELLPFAPLPPLSPSEPCCFPESGEFLAALLFVVLLLFALPKIGPAGGLALAG
jgi:hypothetical protein